MGESSRGEGVGSMPCMHHTYITANILTSSLFLYCTVGTIAAAGRRLILLCQGLTLSRKSPWTGTAKMTSPGNAKTHHQRLFLLPTMTPSHSVSNLVAPHPQCPVVTQGVMPRQERFTTDEPPCTTRSPLGSSQVHTRYSLMTKRTPNPTQRSQVYLFLLPPPPPHTATRLTHRCDIHMAPVATPRSVRILPSFA